MSVDRRVDTWYLDNLVCPREHGAFAEQRDAFVCTRSHRYPVVDGMRVMLVDEICPTARVPLTFTE